MLVFYVIIDTKLAVLSLRSVVCVNGHKSVLRQDGVRSSYKLRQFGVGEDSIVGFNFHTNTQNHWRSGL